jgi:hypothetical protein
MSHKDAANSFFAQPQEIQDALLSKARSKTFRTDGEEAIDRARRLRLRLGGVSSQESYEEIWKEMSGEGGIDLGDGWCRIFTLNKYGLLQVNCATRYAEEWLSDLVREGKSLKDMSMWPQGHGGLKANPWRIPFFHKVVCAKPVWHEELQQFSVALDGEVYVEPPMSEAARARRLKKRQQGARSKAQRRVVSLTWYFGREIIKDRRMPGYWTPRKQMQARPWKRGDRIISNPKERVPAFFSPDEHDLLILHSEESVPAKKGRLIRRHTSERTELLPGDIKEVIEYWLKVYGYNDPFPR